MSDIDSSDFVEIVRALYKKWVDESSPEDQVGVLSEGEIVLLATKLWKSRFHETNVVFENDVKTIVSNKVKNI